MKRLLTFSLLTLLILLSACAPKPSGDLVATEYAKLAATATYLSFASKVAQIQTEIARQTQGLPPQSVTPPAVTQVTPQDSPTPEPSQTPVPSQTPLPTAIPSATRSVTPVPVPCNRAEFVKDVSIPDGTVVNAGSKFNKVWRLRNSGGCAWTKSYALSFVKGDQMSGASPQSLGVSVPPGQTVDVGVELKAPSNVGAYTGEWMLRDSYGAVFGVGQDARGVFTVNVRVVAPITSDNYDIVSNLCNLEWRSEAGVLPCPGSDGDKRGFAFKLSKPRWESGATDNEPALLTHPQIIEDGYIQGKLPPYKVQSGDRFRSVIGCEFGAKSCKVTFRLDYQLDGKTYNLKSWNESYDGNFTVVDVDLSSLNGKSVNFILMVHANGAANSDRAIWLLPRLVRPAKTATPTVTRTASRTPTASSTPTASNTPTASSTPTATATPTASNTPTATATPPDTATPTETATETPKP